MSDVSCVVHGDLRGENILLDANLHVQIADFGLTRLLDATNTQSGAKHLNFAAPELFGRPEDADNPTAEDPPRTQMSDVYAFGCIYYEIHYDCIPFAGRKEIQLVTLVSRGNRPPRQDEPPLSDRAWELIQWCWVTEPPKQPRMKDIAEHMMAIYQRVSPPTSARNDGMLQDASLSLSTSSTTVRRTRVVPSTPLRVTFGGFQEYNDEDSFTDAPPFSSPSSPDAHATYHAPISDGLSMSPTDPSQRMHSMSVGITELRPSVVHASQSFASHGQFLSSGTPSQPVSHLPAKVKAFNLAVKGIAPLWVGLDALKSQAQLASNTPLALKIQLWTSSASAPLTGHDFSPSLYFTSWTHSEKCITKLFINGQMNSSEHTPLTPTYAGQGYVTVALPEFYLNQYRRLNPSLAIVITQEIVADDQTLLFIVYIMDRAASNSPSAKFLSYRVYDHGDKAAAAQFRPMQDKMRSHHHTIETHRPSQPSNTSSIPTVVTEPTPSSSQPRNSNSFSGSIKSPEAASQFPRHAGPSVPAMTAPEETTVPSSQQQDLHHNTGAHQLSQPPSAEPHPTANTTVPPSNSSSLPPPDNSYPGNPFRPQFTTSSPQYNYSTAPAASSARFNNVLPPFVSRPYYVNHPTAPVAASSEREPARSDALPPFTSAPYYVNDPTTPAEAGRSGSRSINSLLPLFTSPESSAWLSSSAQYTPVPEYTNAPFSAPPQSYASGIPPAPPEVGLAPGYASTSYTRSTSYPSTPYRPTPDASTRRREESK